LRAHLDLYRLPLISQQRIALERCIVLGWVVDAGEGSHHAELLAAVWRLFNPALWRA